MIIFYAVFYVILNALILNFLKVNKMRLDKTVVFILLIVMISISISHFFIFKETYVSNNLFFESLFKSLLIPLSYIGSKIPIAIMKKNKKLDFENSSVYFLFNAMRSYYIPGAITLLQVVALFQQD